MDMHPLALFLGARALDLSRPRDVAPPSVDEHLPPIASTAETAAAWRRWRAAGNPAPDPVMREHRAGALRSNPG
jgi:hypothetical protein